MPAALPIDPYIPEILDGLGARRAAVVVASPGAGKTTRLPPALTAGGAVILLQPRRVAARSIARRIAAEQGWALGREVGWHVRFDRQFTRETRLLVATEGILTARLQQDPLLSDFHTIVLDEFHERSIHADLGIALAKQAWPARSDLRLVVMSATIDAERVAAYLDGCPVFDVPGAAHPIEVRYWPGIPIRDAVADASSRTVGQVLCFLPGAPEVRRAAAEIRDLPGLDVVELHGSLSAEEQDRAIAEVPHRRVIVATNIAETSLTVPGVRAVVDTGRQKVARYDPNRGVDSLELERVSRDSADQRAGRAGRLGPGIVLRLWHEGDRLRVHREPEISRVDLSGPVLEVLAWGGDPRTFEWFDPPPPESLEAAFELLRALGALDGGTLTPTGRRMAAIAAHPRLARILIAAEGAFEAAAACALLSDRLTLPRHPPTTTCDLLDAIHSALPPHLARNATELQRTFNPAGRLGERGLRRALLAGYPDRVARRRAPGDPRVLLASGHGAALGPESGVRDGEFLIALDVQGGRRGDLSEARIRIAAVAEKEWLAADSSATVHEVRDGAVRATRQRKYGAIILSEEAVQPDPDAAASALAEEYFLRGSSDEDQQIVARLRFAALDVDLRETVWKAAAGKRSLPEIRLQDGLDWSTRQQLDVLAPATLTAPSGRAHALDYREDGSVALSIKLQELFGLAETPVIGRRREPLLILLLAPNGRPVQTTRDLRSFWNTTYPEVRKELRGRYPKHPWPEDPWTAPPTARAKRRGD